MSAPAAAAAQAPTTVHLTQLQKSDAATPKAQLKPNSRKGSNASIVAAAAGAALNGAAAAAGASASAAHPHQHTNGKPYYNHVAPFYPNPRIRLNGTTTQASAGYAAGAGYANGASHTAGGAAYANGAVYQAPQYNGVAAAMPPVVAIATPPVPKVVDLTQLSSEKLQKLLTHHTRNMQFILNELANRGVHHQVTVNPSQRQQYTFQAQPR